MRPKCYQAGIPEMVRSILITGINHNNYFQDCQYVICKIAKNAILSFFILDLYRFWYWYGNC